MIHTVKGFSLISKAEVDVFLEFSCSGGSELKHLPPIRETWLRSLGWEYTLEKEMVTYSSILAWRIPWTGSVVGYSPWGCKESDTTERLHFHLTDVGN